MAELPTVDDHGLEVLRKAGFVPDDASPTQYGLRTSATGTFSVSGLTVKGLDTEVDVDSSSWTKLPTTSLPARNSLLVQNQSDVNVKITFVDNITGGYVGFLVTPGNHYTTDITPSIEIYGRSEAGSSKTLLVREIA